MSRRTDLQCTSGSLTFIREAKRVACRVAGEQTSWKEVVASNKLSPA